MGCGGVNDVVPVNYNGDFNGTYAISSPATAGTLTMHVAKDGGIVANLTETGSGSTATISMTGTFTGSVDGNYQATGGSKRNVTGLLVKVTDTSYTMSVTLLDTGATISFNLTKTA